MTKKLRDSAYQKYEVIYFNLTKKTTETNSFIIYVLAKQGESNGLDQSFSVTAITKSDCRLLKNKPLRFPCLDANYSNIWSVTAPFLPPSLLGLPLDRQIYTSQTTALYNNIITAISTRAPYCRREPAARCVYLCLPSCYRVTSHITLVINKQAMQDQVTDVGVPRSKDHKLITRAITF